VQGSGANSICLHQHPTKQTHKYTSFSNAARVYGIAYESTFESRINYEDRNHRGHFDFRLDWDREQAACAVCVSKTPVTTVWGRVDCDKSGEASELVYYGKVMGPHDRGDDGSDQFGRGEFNCVDDKRVTHKPSHATKHHVLKRGAHWMTAESVCGDTSSSFPCQCTRDSDSQRCDGYANGRELACAVCRVPDATSEAPQTIRSTYVRWGGGNCDPLSREGEVPNTFKQQFTNHKVLYQGFAAGAEHDDYQGGYNLMCMNKDNNSPLPDKYGNPGFKDGREWGTNYLDDGNQQYDHGDKNEGTSRGPQVYGTEYYTNWNGYFGTEHNSKNKYQVAGCTVCGSPNSATHTVWGRTTCPYAGWVLEYQGLAMTADRDHRRQRTECLDKHQDSFATWRDEWNAERSADQYKYPNPGRNDGATNRLYTTEFRENLFAATYVKGFELPCAVCSRP